MPVDVSSGDVIRDLLFQVIWSRKAVFRADKAAEPDLDSLRSSPVKRRLEKKRFDGGFGLAERRIGADACDGLPAAGGRAVQGFRDEYAARQDLTRSGAQVQSGDGLAAADSAAGNYRTFDGKAAG